MADPPAGLRERMRRTVLNEIAEVALKLFTERGYETVTIDDIATAAGLSRRSVFRYFSTKEDIVVGKFDFVADDMLAELRARPAGEPYGSPCGGPSTCSSPTWTRPASTRSPSPCSASCSRPPPCWPATS